MSCGGCVANVEKALGEIDGVNKATVNLNPPKAKMRVNQTISTNILQAALAEAGGYRIVEEEEKPKKPIKGCCG
ncbi:heavy-metal-associated domain-containing protein [Brumimicrobium glaciale]|uniref:Heavy-metal-associated domain-containing protein n=1 Tax=Brumimicrobium glaciale TaxID=200475 RepID=A0A4Q4KIW0_9FLAO|nr:heavy-metal-associated domain-containing protein [Brumimicrobium glaciale]